MNTREAYNRWAAQYDSDENKTSDLEAFALRTELAGQTFEACLEMGCGTGKNTAWLIGRTNRLICIDQSEQMLAKAKEKIRSPKANFTQADMTSEWNVGHNAFDLVTFSLVLEHVENLDDIFRKASEALLPGGQIYVGELHPFRQYGGSKAKFATTTGLQIINCYTHQLSDFCGAAKKNGLSIVSINEYFDEDTKASFPRILTAIFKK